MTPFDRPLTWMVLLLFGINTWTMLWFFFDQWLWRLRCIEACRRYDSSWFELSAARPVCSTAVVDLAWNAYLYDRVEQSNDPLTSRRISAKGKTRSNPTLAA